MSPFHPFIAKLLNLESKKVKRKLHPGSAFIELRPWQWHNGQPGGLSNERLWVQCRPQLSCEMSFLISSLSGSSKAGSKNISPITRCLSDTRSNPIETFEIQVSISCKICPWPRKAQKVLASQKQQLFEPIAKNLVALKFVSCLQVAYNSFWAT